MIPHTLQCKYGKRFCDRAKRENNYYDFKIAGKKYFISIQKHTHPLPGLRMAGPLISKDANSCFPYMYIASLSIRML